MNDAFNRTIERTLMTSYAPVKNIFFKVSVHLDADHKLMTDFAGTSGNMESGILSTFPEAVAKADTLVELFEGYFHDSCDVIEQHDGDNEYKVLLVDEKQKPFAVVKIDTLDFRKEVFH